MNLPDTILEYAVRRGAFSKREICRHCCERQRRDDALFQASIAKCLRQLKSHGYLHNKRDFWYVRQQLKNRLR